MNKTYILLLIIVFGFTNTILPQNIDQFKKLLPRSQWSDYSADIPHSAVLIDEQGNTFVISQRLGPIHLVMQKISPDGELLWANPNIGLNISPGMLYGDAGFAPKLVSDDKGGIFVLYAYSTFNSIDGDWWYDYDVYLQLVDSDGNLLFGDKGIAILANSGVITEYPVDLVADGNGGVFALYSGKRSCPWGRRYLQHIDSLGNQLFVEPGINVSECDTVGLTRIVPAGDSDYFLLGVKNCLQKISKDGEILFPLPGLKTGLNDLTKMYFFNTSDNEYVVLGNNYYEKTILGQKFDGNGNLMWGDHGVSYTWPDSIHSSSIISESDNSRYYVFSSEYYMVLKQDGSFENSVPLRAIVNDTLSLCPKSAAYSPEYGTFVLYVESLSVGTKIFIQRITKEGSKPWGENGILLCDDKAILATFESIIKIRENDDHALIFVEFHEGIHMADLDLATGSYVTGITQDRRPSVPQDITIKNYPNPFYYSVTIQIEQQNNVSKFQSVKVYNLLGKEVKDLTHQLSSGHTLTWDGTDINQRQAAAGIYFIQVNTNRLYTQKVIKLH